MENKICAKNITELSVITLMNGKKTRVALKNEDDLVKDVMALKAVYLKD